MKPATALLSLGLALVACSNPARRPPPARPAPSTAPSTSPSTSRPPTDAALDGSTATPLRVFSIGGVCNRTPQAPGRAYGPNAHPVFTRGILEIELRAFPYACSGLEFEPSIVGNTLVLNAPTKRDANGCTCRHDQMLQVTGTRDNITQVRFVRPNPGADGGVEEIMIRGVDTRPRPSPAEPAADASTSD